MTRNWEIIRQILMLAVAECKRPALPPVILSALVI